MSYIKILGFYSTIYLFYAFHSVSLGTYFATLDSFKNVAKLPFGENIKSNSFEASAVNFLVRHVVAYILPDPDELALLMIDHKPQMTYDMTIFLFGIFFL